MEMEEWGTWEELILASAVLRHGTCDWEAVVAELRPRTFAPGRFTAEVCQEKYEDLQQHYLTCSDLLEVLRKKRIAELRRTLEKSSGSIGFLQTKLQSLKAEKEHSSSVDYQCSPFESPAQTSAGKSSGKEASKDGLSAGSFTQEICNIWSPPLHVPASENKPQQLDSSQPDTVLNSEDIVKSMHMKWGIRGKRKRRDCGQNVKEEKVDETFLDPPGPNLPLLSRIKAEPTSECLLASPLHIMNKFNQGTDGSKCYGLSKIFDMISSTEYASIFQRRLDSQKRARYRMIVRQHLDLSVIKSRIDKQAITSTKELLRDLLLLATNAVTFYSRNTHEHKYAVILRGIINKLVTECMANSPFSRIPPAVATSPAVATAPRTPPATPLQLKPASANPTIHKSPEKVNNGENIGRAPEGAKKPCKSKDSLLKISGQARKLNRQTQNIRDASKAFRHEPNANKSKDGSKQQPQAKKAFVNVNITKVASMQQPQAELANLKAPNISKEGSKQQSNSRNCKDGYRRQQQVKSPAANEWKDRKRARKI